MAGTDTLDMVIQKVGCPEVLEGGWMEWPQGPVFAAPQPASPGRRGSVTLLRRGGLRLPITLWARLENRTEQRLTWDGQDRWVTFEFDSPVTAAILDPDGNYPMLKDRLHANYSAQPVAPRACTTGPSWSGAPSPACSRAPGSGDPEEPRI